MQHKSLQSRETRSKSCARTFDGYKCHLGIDPADELITGVAVTLANAADREAIDELLGNPATATDADETITDHGEHVHNESEPNVFEVYRDSAYTDGATLDEDRAGP